MSRNQSSRRDGFFDRCFRDEQGRVVIAQWPNWPLWTWAGASGLQWAMPAGPLAALCGLVSFAGIVYWAGLEILAGANYFRRFLGLVVLMFVMVNRLL